MVMATSSPRSGGGLALARFNPNLANFHFCFEREKKSGEIM
jgi:hypothetical protein